MFHEVTDDPGLSGFQRPGALAYKHTQRAFTQCLDAIAGAPTPLGLITAADFTRSGRHILLTFDDGGKSAVAVSEQLAQRGWHGHFFIVTSLIGGRTFVNEQEIRAIRRAGHLIGSHSHTHPSIFRDLPPARMVDEWRTSSDILAQLLGEPILTASVPGGEISGHALESADRAGLRYLFTSEPALRPRRVGDCWILGRFSVKTGTLPTRVGELAHFRGWTQALFRRRLKVLATRLVPPLYRAYIRFQTTELTDPQR